LDETTFPTELPSSHLVPIILFIIISYLDLQPAEKKMAQNTSLLTLYNSLPLFQRIYLTLSIALPILTTFRIIPYTYLMLPNPLTTHFLHTLNLHLIQKLILAYHALRKIKNVHNKWIVAALIADIIAMGTEIRVLAQTNIAIVVYLWARQEPEERVSLLFGIVIPVRYVASEKAIIILQSSTKDRQHGKFDSV